MTKAPENLTASKEDVEGVTSAVMDYLEGYVQGDGERHAGAYHPECVKRRLYFDAEDGITALMTLTPQMMSDYAATGKSIEEDCDFEIVIDDISEDIASVRCYSCNWVDFIHLAKARGEWRLLHVTWHGRQG